MYTQYIIFYVLCTLWETYLQHSPGLYWETCCQMEGLLSEVGAGRQSPFLLHTEELYQDDVGEIGRTTDWFWWTSLTASDSLNKEEQRVMRNQKIIPFLNWTVKILHEISVINFNFEFRAMIPIPCVDMLKAFWVPAELFSISSQLFLTSAVCQSRNRFFSK